MSGTRGLVLLTLAVLGACSVRDLPHVGRTCAGGLPCGPGTRCDPVELICVDDTQRPDARLDAMAEGIDASPDGPAPSRLACTGVEAVGTSPTPGNPREPALRLDGLQLVAISQASAYRTERSAVDQAFGAWSVASDLPAAFGDPAFFGYEQQEYMIAGASIDKPRHLLICPGVASCQPVTLTDGEDNPIVRDVDGPAVASSVNGLPLMVFNATDELFQARPTLFDFTAWFARPLELPPGAAARKDDPAISPDGTIVLFSDDDDLWVARRAQAAAPFAPPARLEIGNQGEAEQEPCLADYVEGRLELFFVAVDGDDASQIRRAICDP